MKLTKSYLRKLIQEELQEAVYPKHAEALINGIILYFGVSPEEAKELLEEFEDAVYWRNKNK